MLTYKKWIPTNKVVRHLIAMWNPKNRTRQIYIYIYIQQIACVIINTEKARRHTS
jgi:hypothetical protein